MLSISCNSKDRPKKPDNLIPIDKMENILYDIYLINAAKGVGKKLLEKNNVIPETYILSKYGIDSLQFATSNDYYAFDSDDYKSIVDHIRSRLTQEKENLEELQKKEKESEDRRKDSINKNKNKRIKDSISNLSKSTKNK
jgi:hypothetical protein